MKILMINRELGTGSVGKICEDLYYGITKEGHSCKVVYANKNLSKIPSEDLFKMESALSIKYNAFMSRLFDDDGLRAKLQTKRLIRFIDNYAPDIVHMHGNYGYYINIQILFNYLAKKRIKIVNTLHSCWDYTGHCCYYTQANCERWKTQCYDCPEKTKYPASILFDNSKRNYTIKKALFSGLNDMTIVTPSKWLANDVKQSFLKNCKTVVIKNGIDTNVFKFTKYDSAKYGIDLSKKIILGVAANWTERKGLKDFIELERYLDSKVYQIVIVGVSEKQKQFLPANILAISRTEGKQDLAWLYSIATVLFNPTYEDNYPTVNIEAIACGTPVITYKTGGSPEAILDCKYGKIVDKKDYRAVVSFIEEAAILKKDKQPQKDILSKERMIKEYCELYKRIMNNSYESHV